MTCSDSGRVPSASVTSSTSCSTARTSSGARRDRVTTFTSSTYGRVLRDRIDGQRIDGLYDELVADVADRADEAFALRPELRAQPAYVHVDGAGAAEVVVTPDLLQQLRAGEDPARMLGEELEQLELLERQVERPAADL